MPEDFQDIFDDVDKLYERLARRMIRDIENIEEAIRSGKLEGKWDIKPIDEPGVKGYIARGRSEFGRRTQPKTFMMPKQVREEIREPLTDVFQDKDSVKLYVELPGVEKNDIQLNVSTGRAEIKAKNFYKTINLPTQDVEAEKATAHYKNGVLEVAIPKTKKTTSDGSKTTIQIE